MKNIFLQHIRIGVLLAILFLLATMFAATAGTQQEATVTLADDMGNEVHLPEPPQSILSLMLFSDEVLLKMLPADRFAAVTSIGSNPVYSNTAEQAAGITPVIEFTVEQVINLYPDLVIAADWSEADKIQQLRQAGIPVYQIATPQNLEDITAGIRTLGRLVNERRGADSIINDMNQRIARLTAAVDAIPEQERVTALDYNSWNSASGSATTWNLVLQLAGITNAAAALEADNFGQAPLSKEALIDIDPDIIFLPGYIWGDDTSADAFFRQITEDPALAGMQAIENDRVYMFPERLKGTYSQYLIEAAETAAAMAYPDHF